MSDKKVFAETATVCGIANAAFARSHWGLEVWTTVATSVERDQADAADATHVWIGSTMTNRRFPSPWTVQRLPGGFKVVDASGQSLAYFYARDNDNDAGTAGVLTMDEGKAVGEQFRQAARNYWATL